MKSLLIPIASRIFPALSCTNCKVSGLILRFLIYFELILVQGDRHGSSFSFLQADSHFSQHHSLKRLSFLYRMFLEPLSKTKWVFCKFFLYSFLSSIQRTLELSLVTLTGKEKELPPHHGRTSGFYLLFSILLLTATHNR
jgi:hypothetical protein